MSVPIEKIIDDDKLATSSGFLWREKNGVKVLVCKELEVLGFANGFSTRIGGVSRFPENDLNLSGTDQDSLANIEENRRRFLSLFPNYRLTTRWQVHGDDVCIVETEKAIADTEEKYDGLVSQMSNLLLGVKTADCVPVLLGDPRSRAFAAIHAGWRGSLQSIVPKAIKLMKKQFATKPEEIVCAIGPAAGGENYEVGDDVISGFKKNFSYADSLLTVTRPGHAKIDLHIANKRQLVDAGVSENNIFTAPYCTMERNDLFFSYRLERKRLGKSGRLLSVIGSR